MKTNINIRSLVLGTLAGAVLILCFGAGAGDTDREPAILKLQDEAGRSIAVVTLLRGSRVAPKDPFKESSIGFRPDSYRVHGSGIQILSPSGEVLFVIDTPHPQRDIVYDFEARAPRQEQNAEAFQQQMEALGAELTALRKQYTDEHPVVQQLIRRMRALAQQQLEQQRK